MLSSVLHWGFEGALKVAYTIDRKLHAGVSGYVLFMQ